LPAPGEAGLGDSAGPLRTVAGLRLRLDASARWFLEVRTDSDARWKSPAKRLVADLAAARPADFEHLPPAEAALGNAFAAECRLDPQALVASRPLSDDAVAGLLRTTAARPALVLPDGSPFTVRAEPLVFQATASPDQPDRLELHLVAPDGRPAPFARLVASRPTPLYLFDGFVWPGPPPAPAPFLPTVALQDARLLPRLRAAGIRLPGGASADVRTVALKPRLRCWLTPAFDESERDLHVQLTARADNPPCEQRWTETAGWQWSPGGVPPARQPGEPVLEFELTAARRIAETFESFRLVWDGWAEAWIRPVSDEFPDEFIAWHDALPDGVDLDVSPELAALLGAPLRGHLSVKVAAAGESEQDWFDLSVGVGVDDAQLTPEDIALLLQAKGKWVSLKRHGWRRLEPDLALDPDAAATLERLGVGLDDVLAGGKARHHRLHALQLAAQADPFVERDSVLVHALRARAARLAALPAPVLPTSLRAELRPYQREGFQFLAQLSQHRLGGVLADDMGLGKTVQTLAWLLHLAEEHKARGAASAAETPEPFRALVVCPKSVTHGWLTETARFAPDLEALAFTPTNPRVIADAVNAPGATQPRLLIANYAQLRLHAAAFRSVAWDAVVLDEGQFIKNPGSQVAVVARALRARHRLVLTGTPIENRLTDLWSLFAFAQPGLLGDQPGFRREYPDADSAAHARLHRRVQHFLLRRTKAQAAPDLPSRTEDDIIIDLEGPQRRLYEAELKRARAHLLGVRTPGELGAVRFHVLASLLRLRQICCHPALVDPVHATLPSAKLDALLERIEELADEGHQVLVFSQFTGMLEIIRTRLAAAHIGHLILTGATENRAELVDQFQTDKTKTVFLLSLKAAGFGLNLTAASYAFLYDPWWNPAAEAQAIDRIHRIGQTRPVTAYRLIADNTVEQKIRALQQEKSALAAAVIQEESVATVMDLDSLREILA
jgi:superfamily II DNA or RNA helicase